MSLTDEQRQALRFAKENACKMGESGRYLTGLIGELSACDVLDLNWQPSEGYDAVSKGGQRIEIKTRRSWSTAKVNPAGRFGRFRHLDKCHEGLLVLLDEQFAVYGIWKRSAKDIAALQSCERPGVGLHVGRFTRDVEPVFSRAPA